MASVVIAQLVRFGGVDVTNSVSPIVLDVRYTAVSLGVALLWIAALTVVDSRSTQVLFRGAEEYRRILSGTFLLFGFIAIMSLLLRMDIARGYLAIAFPLGATALLVNRRVWRSIIARRDTHAVDQRHVLVVGSRSAAANVATQFCNDRQSGFKVVGLCTPEGPTSADDHVTVADRELPIVGIDRAIIDVVQRIDVDTIAIAPTDHLTPTEIRRLIWDLDTMAVDLIVTAGLMDVADQRIHAQPVAGMAMLHVAKPQYGRATSWAKRLFDMAFSTTALFVVAPLMVLAAFAVKMSSPGPIFYRADRIGLNGATFKMLKFRSMQDGADRLLPGMIASGAGNDLLFKLKDDPRVTPVGHILRKFSVDELPQFFNVLKGDMSVVGPRPQVLREVERYDDLMSRRLLVRPGLTGLWQVSGRSDLSANDAYRLDLSYVENWTMAQDLIIIARTLQAVLSGAGAY